MKEYIEVGHLKKSVEELPDCYNGFSDTYSKACIIDLIDEEPVADVVSVVHGHWILTERAKGFPDWKCSVCGGSGRGDHTFCEWCNAKMDEAAE